MQDFPAKAEITKYFATFGGDHLPDFDFPGGSMTVMLVSETGQTENEFRASMGPGTVVDNKYFTTYPLEEAHRMHIDYGMREYAMAEFMARRLT